MKPINIDDLDKFRDQTFLDLENLLFEAEDKSADVFGKTPKSSKVAWARRFCSDLLYYHSRHYLKADFVEDIATSHNRAIGIPREDIPYDRYFAAPSPFENNNEFALSLLGVAVALNPANGPAWLNLGISQMREKLWDKAIISFTKGLEFGGVVSGYSGWFLADALWEAGRKAEAIENYTWAFSAAPDLTGIMGARAADRLREEGHVRTAVVIYERCLAYSHTHVPEFVQMPLENSYTIQLTRFDPEPATLIESDASGASELLGCPASIWEARDRYYAVPSELGHPTPAMLTISGLTNTRWSTPIEKAIAESTAMGRLFAAATKTILRGVWTRGMRRKIKSANRPDDLQQDRKEILGALSEPTTDGLYDDLGLFYSVYISVDGKYYAVPMRMEPFAPIEIGTIDLQQTGWRAALDGIIGYMPFLYRYGYPVLRKLLPGVVRRFERRRIRKSDAIDDLATQVHQAGTTNGAEQ